jgi:hypothetical protein
VNLRPGAGPHLLPGVSETALSGESKDRARLTLGLTVFLTTILVALSCLTFTLISQVFAQYEESVRQDLAWKAVGGAHEIAAAGARGIASRDQPAILGALGQYQTNGDVEAVAVVDRAGAVLATHGRSPEQVLGLFQGPPDTVQIGRQLRAWAPAVHEGQEVGRVAVAISPRRLDVAATFRDRVLMLAGGGAVAALVLSLLFAAFFVGPKLSQVEEAPAPRPPIDDPRIAELELALAQARRHVEVVDGVGTPAVLQELGNALSGVNVSAAVVADTIRGSRVAGLEKALALIEANGDDLARFFRDDPKGRRLPEYLRALAEAATQERATISREIAALQAKVARIKEIVGRSPSAVESERDAG